ncbi:anaphase-promoting complex, subunit 10-domain-containing protein [Delphinella strobiligena]|nr:anaphase-promoting complex, subunit 10-domain-containing protein [Delphinella strobiligena]
MFIDSSFQAQTHAALTPCGLKEISSLASWTVSTSKPGCGVAALRSPDTSLFWQSDGPQPHLLSIHFFKLVSIAHMRIFLDFDNDESYTPTKMQFLAGMGVYDLQEFAEMTFEQPRGWIDVDFSQRPLLRCFLVQVKILENHQNGKDTHLRGFQIFARDERADEARERRESVDQDAQERALTIAERPKASKKRSDAPGLKKAGWMMEPELR